MKDIFGTILILQFFVPAISGAQTTENATITWSAPLSAQEASDVRTEGTLIEAVNAAGTNTGSVTVNGVQFTNSTNLLSAATEASLLSRSTGDDGYDFLLGTVDFGNGPDEVELAIGAQQLVPGKNYLLQVWWTDGRRCCGNPRKMTIGDGLGQSVVLNSYGSKGFGQYAIGLFEARGVSQTMTLDTAGLTKFGSSGNAHITAYQVREVPFDSLARLESNVDTAVEVAASSVPPTSFAVVERETPTPRFAETTATVVERLQQLIVAGRPDLQPLPSEHQAAFQSLFQVSREQATEAYGVDLVIAVELQAAPDVTVLGVSIYEGLEQKGGYSDRYVLDRNRGLAINEDTLKLVVSDFRHTLRDVTQFYEGRSAEKRTVALNTVAAARPESVVVDRTGIRGDGGVVNEASTNTPFTGTVLDLSNGRQFVLTPFVDGRRHGLAESYYGFPNKLQRQWTYNQGQFDGELLHWSPYGPLVLQTQYADNVEAGVRTEWFHNSELSLRAFIEDGKQVGLSYHWTAKGEFSHCQHPDETKARDCPAVERIGSADSSELSRADFQDAG